MTSLAVAGSALAFQVRRVFCVGRNYADHAREMGADPEREPPFFFAKPADAVFLGDVPYPSRTRDFQHEVELVVALGSGGSELAIDTAGECVQAYAVGIDWTRRDLQSELKRLGRPWEVAKAFDKSASIGVLQPRKVTGELKAGHIWLAVNGERKQTGDLADMIWSVPEIIAELSTYVRLEAGDLIYTGTPAGVGAVQVGDRITAGVAGLVDLDLQVLAPA